MVLLIAYELFDKTRDISKAIEQIKSTGYWWHHLENIWIIETHETPAIWQERLLPYFQKTDNLLIIQLEGKYGGLLPVDAWTWLKDRRYK